MVAISNKLPNGLDYWNSLFSTVLHTVSGAHPASYTMGTCGTFPGVNRPGRNADNSPLSSAGAKNACSYTSIPPYVFTAWYLVKYRDFYLYLPFVFVSVVLDPMLFSALSF